MTERDFAELLAAMQAQNERMAALLERNESAASEAVNTVQVSEVLDRYCAEMRATNPKFAASAYQYAPLRRFFGDMRVCDLKRLTWKQYAIDRMAGRVESGKSAGKPIRPITVNHDMAMFNGALNWAVESQIIEVNPLAGMKRIPNAKARKQGALRESDLDEVLRHCPNMLTQVFYVVELDSGLRRDECRLLRWTDIDLDSRIIHIRNGKGGKARDVPTSQRAVDFLRRLPQGVEWVFMNRRTDKPYGRWMINHWVRMAVQDSGIEARYGGQKVRNHGARRGMATNAVERGVDVRAVQEILGHSSLVTTEGYIDSRMDHLKRMMAEKFEAGIGIKTLPRIGPKRAAGEETPLPARLKIVK